MSPAQVRAFVRQVALVTLVGETDPSIIATQVRQRAASAPGPFEGAAADVAVPTLDAGAPSGLILDPAGYFVVYPEARGNWIPVEHYTNAGMLDCILRAQTPASLYATIIEKKLISRLDPAAYLGRELARAERSQQTGEPYVQDRAAGNIPEEQIAAACGCSSSRNGGEDCENS